MLKERTSHKWSTDLAGSAHVVDAETKILSMVNNVLRNAKLVDAASGLTLINVLAKRDIKEGDNLCALGGFVCSIPPSRWRMGFSLGR